MRSPARFYFVLSLCATIACSSLMLGQQITVTGQVEFTGSTSTRSADSSGVVVWLTRSGDGTHGEVVALEQEHQLLQKRKSFSPHLLVVQIGSAVEFPNQDPFFHNVFSLFEGKRFDLGLYEAGSSRTVAFNRAGISYIFCNIHPEMSAVVVTLKTPYYAISDRKGMISIPNVPLGRYQMQIWHERVLPETLSNLARTVSISVQTSSLGVVRLPKQRNLSSLHKNKYGQDYETPTLSTPRYPRP